MPEHEAKQCTLKVYGNGCPDMLVDELGFSWKVEGVEGAQKAYRLTVAGEDGTPVWGTGLVSSTLSSGIEYEGPALESNAAYTAEVAVEAEDVTADGEVHEGVRAVELASGRHHIEFAV